MIYKTTKEFQDAVLTKMSFEEYNHDFHIIYKNFYTIYKNKKRPELGHIIKYKRERYYDFSIGDYTICDNFSLCFNNNESLMKFGTVYSGETFFEIENSTASSFTPSSFFIAQNNLKGRQDFKKGQHFHGAEITIYKKYFDEIIKPNFPNSIDFNNFIENYTYNYLPMGISSIVQSLKSMAEQNVLTPLYLESKVLECIALFYKEVSSSHKNIISNELNYDEIKIGKDRTVTLTASDISAITKAYDILTKEALNPPTIRILSKTVFLNEQKLKAGFKAKYHMSIKKYTNTIKMSMAENLLLTTELSIDEISTKLGYTHSGNFIKSFKIAHGKTPLAFRKEKRSI